MDMNEVFLFLLRHMLMRPFRKVCEGHCNGVPVQRVHRQAHGSQSSQTYSAKTLNRYTAKHAGLLYMLLKWNKTMAP